MAYHREIYHTHSNARLILIYLVVNLLMMHEVDVLLYS